MWQHFSKIICGLSLVLVFATSDCVQAFQVISGVSFEANRINNNSTKNMIELSGNVQVIFQGQYLSCDKATINLKTQELTAEGHVILQDQTTYIEGTWLKFNYKTNLGTIHNGFIKLNSAVLRGRVIEKTGEEEYLFEQAYYSNCATCPPSWSFTGTKIKARIGEYAYINYPVLRILNVPVFFLPWIFLPLKSDRQSGFLSPRVSFRNIDEIGASLSYFWAISRSQDATFRLTTFEKEGFKPYLNYRYVLTENSRGFFNGSFFKDKTFERSVRNSTTSHLHTVQQEQQRWFFKYHHHYEMPERITHRADLNITSDTKYIRDFPYDLNANGESALENQISLTKNYENTHLSGEVGFYINQLVEDPLEKNRNSVHRFPEIRFSLTEQQIGKTPLYFNFESHYTHFARQHFTYDDVVPTGSPIGDGFTCPANSVFCISRERDGAFEPSKGDLLRTGHRFVANPQLKLPFRVSDFLETFSLISYQENQYRFTTHTDEANSLYDSTAAQRFLELEVKAKTRFFSIFDNMKSKKSTKYKHIIEPEIRYSTTPWIQRSNHYFFGQPEEQTSSQANTALQDSDFFGVNKVQFDYKDRIYDQHLIDLGFTSRLIRKNWAGDKPWYNSLFFFRLSQSFDFNQAKAQNQPWSNVNALIDLRSNNFNIHSKAVYYPYAQLTNSSTRFMLKDQKGKFIQVTYTHSMLVNKNNEVNPNNKTRNIGLTLGWTGKHFHFTSNFNYSRVTKELLSWSYNTLIKLPGDCWGIRLTQFQLYKGKSEFEFMVNFDFSGDINSKTFSF